MNEWTGDRPVDQNAREWFSRRFGGKVRYGEPMARHTSLGVGGPAEVYLVPNTLADLGDAVRFSWENGLPYLVLGGGTNLLVRDEGLKGLVISLSRCSQGIDRADVRGDVVSITVLAGTRLQAFCRYALDHGFGGINFAFGIPGTIGGGIWMNAGTDLGQMGGVLEGISVMHPTGRIQVHSGDDLRFGYRSFSLGGLDEARGNGQPILLNGRFALEAADPGVLRREAQAIIECRKLKHPMGEQSAGCFFKNPQGGKSAGELIELSGLKGKQIGGAAVSVKHANFFINTGSASSADFLALMEAAQEAVSSRFGIDLDAEVTIVGS